MIGRALALTLALAITGSASDAHADEDAERIYRPNKPLILVGFMSLALPYTVSAFVGLSSPRSEDRALFIPLAGPWLDLAIRSRCPATEGSCEGETSARVGLVFDGILQGIGLVAMVAGFLWRHDELVRRSVFVTPWSSAHGGGIGIAGAFD